MNFFLSRGADVIQFRAVRTQKEHTHEEMSHAPAFGNKLSRLLLPAWTFAVLAFLYLPIVLLVIYSFNQSPLNVVWKGSPPAMVCRRSWNDRLLCARKAVENSLLIAAAATVVSVVLGTLAAWLLHRYRFPGTAATTTLLIVPMIIPEVIMGVSLMLLFQATGVSRGYVTVIIAHTTFCFPFVMAAVQARLAGLDPALEEAALDLGATPRRAFFRVIMPYLLPGIAAGAILAFALSIDEFVVTYFTCNAGSTTLPVRTSRRRPSPVA